MDSQFSEETVLQQIMPDVSSGEYQPYNPDTYKDSYSAVYNSKDKTWVFLYKSNLVVSTLSWDDKSLDKDKLLEDAGISEETFGVSDSGERFLESVIGVVNISLNNRTREQSIEEVDKMVEERNEDLTQDVSDSVDKQKEKDEKEKEANKPDIIDIEVPAKDPAKKAKAIEVVGYVIKTPEIFFNKTAKKCLKNIRKTNREDSIREIIALDTLYTSRDLITMGKDASSIFNFNVAVKNLKDIMSNSKNIKSDIQEKIASFNIDTSLERVRQTLTVLIN